MTALFIDVSHHDWSRRGGALDWAAIRGAGLGTVMCARASYGDPQVFNPSSPHFADYMAGAKAAGFTARGAYHNLIRGDQASINRQVDLLRAAMDRHGGTWAMADVEAYDELVTQGLVPRWEDVQRFHDRWYQVEPNRVMAWYIAQWVWAGKLGAPNLTGLKGPLINANYRGGDGTAQQIYAAAGGGGWAQYVTVINGVTRRSGRTPDIWQYTSTGNVPGASSNTDCNAYRGELAALVALLTGGTVPSGGTNDMAFMDDQNARYLAYREHCWAEYVDEVTTNVGEVVTHKGVAAVKALAADVAALKAQAAEDQTRDAAMLAAIYALAAGGGVDAAPIVAAVREEAAKTREVLAAAAQAEADRLKG